MLGGVANLEEEIGEENKAELELTPGPATVPHPAGQGACTPPGTPEIGMKSSLFTLEYLAEPPVPVVGDVPSIHDLSKQVPGVQCTGTLLYYTWSSTVLYTLHFTVLYTECT